MIVGGEGKKHYVCYSIWHYDFEVNLIKTIILLDNKNIKQLQN